MKLLKATRLNDDGNSGYIGTVDVREPVKQLSETDLIEKRHRLDTMATLEAIEKCGGPFGGRIIFIEGADGAIYAGETETSEKSLAANVADILYLLQKEQS